MAGKVSDAAGECMPACEYDSAIASNSPDCHPPCTAPHEWNGTACAVPSSYCYSKTRELSAGHWPFSLVNQHFCDGTCDVALRPANGVAPEEACFWWSDDVAQSDPLCVFDKDYNGEVCNGANVPATQSGPTSSTAKSEPGCPTGYTKNSSGMCDAPAVGGTASTSTTGGTAATPGATVCPVGYTDSGNGQCTDRAPSNIGCPNGYTQNAAGVCTSIGTVSDGAGSREAETAPVEAGGTAGKSVIGAAADGFSNLLATIANSVVPHGWTWGISSLNLPTASCSPWVIQVGGRTVTIDYCPIAQKIREIGGYVLYIMTMIGLFNILAGPRPT